MTIDAKTLMLWGALTTSGSCVGNCTSSNGCGRDFARNRAREVDSITNTYSCQRATDLFYSDAGRGIVTLVGIGGLLAIGYGALGSLASKTRRRND